MRPRPLMTVSTTARWLGLAALAALVSTPAAAEQDVAVIDSCADVSDHLLLPAHFRGCYGGTSVVLICGAPGGYTVAGPAGPGDLPRLRPGGGAQRLHTRPERLRGLGWRLLRQRERL